MKKAIYPERKIIDTTTNKTFPYLRDKGVLLSKNKKYFCKVCVSFTEFETAYIGNAVYCKECKVLYIEYPTSPKGELN